MLVFCFSIFHFDEFLTTFAKDLIKKNPLVFITNIKINHKFLHFHKDLSSRNFWQWNDGPLKFCENCTETRFLFSNLRPVFILKYVISARFLLSWQKWSLESFWIWSDGSSKTLIFNFSFVLFDNFWLLLLKIYEKKPRFHNGYQKFS